MPLPTELLPETGASLIKEVNDFTCPHTLQQVLYEVEPFIPKYFGTHGCLERSQGLPVGDIRPSVVVSESRSMDVLFEPLFYELATLRQAEWGLLDQSLGAGSPRPLCLCELAFLWFLDFLWQNATS